MTDKPKSALERIVEITPAFDKRHTDPKKDYGIGSVDMKFLLKGEKGVIQFVILTGWFLPQNTKPVQDTSMYPMAYDIGRHSYVPRYDDESPITQECPYLDGKPCYYDGSSLQAKKIFDVMVAEGGEAMWKEMEEYYKTWLGPQPAQGEG